MSATLGNLNKYDARRRYTCPGSGQKPGEKLLSQHKSDSGVCGCCGRIYALTKRGRMRVHRGQE